MLVSQVLCELECLISFFQERTATVAGMMAAVEVSRASLRATKTKEALQLFFEEVTAVVQSLGVLLVWSVEWYTEQTTPKHFIGDAEAHQSKSGKYHKRVESFKVLHTAEAELTELFKQGDLLTF